MFDEEEPTAYANVDDLEARWRTLDASERDRGTVLLGDARIHIGTECPPVEPLTVAQIEARKIVSCNMVKRAMINSDQAAGVSSTQATAGPFNRSFSFSNPTGDLYITKAERKMLGCRRGRPFTIDTTPPRVEVLPWMGTTM